MVHLLEQMLEPGGVPFMFERGRRFENFLIVCIVYLLVLLAYADLFTGTTRTEDLDSVIFAELITKFGLLPLLVVLAICQYAKTDLGAFVLSSFVVAATIPFFSGIATARQDSIVGYTRGGYEWLIPWFGILWAASFLIISLLHFLGGIKWWRQ